MSAWCAWRRSATHVSGVEGGEVGWVADLSQQHAVMAHCLGLIAPCSFLGYLLWLHRIRRVLNARLCP